MNKAKGPRAWYLKNMVEMNVVLVKKFKKKVAINSPLVQSLIFYEQSKRGWGPKLFGLFENGRVEELVDCHTLTAEEAFTSEMIKDLAKAYARFNSHNLPLGKEPRNMLQEAMLSVEPSKNYLRELIKSGDVRELNEANYPFEEVLNFPYYTEIKWTQSIASKIKQRLVFCTLDNNYLNRLVRNIKQDDENATRTLIIDFDLSGYEYRGFELAGHFVMRMFDFSKDSKRSNFSIPTKSERTEFLIAYLEECKLLFDDFDPNSLDSLEHLILEVDFNLCCYSLACVTYCVQMVKLFQQDPSFGRAYVQTMLDLQKEMKETFCKKYPSMLN